MLSVYNQICATNREFHALGVSQKSTASINPPTRAGISMVNLQDHKLQVDLIICNAVASHAGRQLLIKYDDEASMIAVLPNGSSTICESQKTHSRSIKDALLIIHHQERDGYSAWVDGAYINYSGPEAIYLALLATLHQNPNCISQQQAIHFRLTLAQNVADGCAAIAMATQQQVTHLPDAPAEGQRIQENVAPSAAKRHCQPFTGRIVLELNKLSKKYRHLNRNYKNEMMETFTRTNNINQASMRYYFSATGIKVNGLAFLEREIGVEYKQFQLEDAFAWRDHVKKSGVVNFKELYIFSRKRDLSFSAAVTLVKIDGDFTSRGEKMLHRGRRSRLLKYCILNPGKPIQDVTGEIVSLLIEHYNEMQIPLTCLDKIRAKLAVNR